MRRDRERMLDIMEALDSLARSLLDWKEADFLSHDLLYDASARKLTIAGEAAARHTRVEWQEVIGLRNVRVHEYLGVDRPRVWQVPSVEAPLLRDRIAAMPQAEFRE